MNSYLVKLVLPLAISLLMHSASGDVSSLISPQLYDQMLPHRNDAACEAKNNFYSYDAFITAANFFPGFGTTGDVTTQKRELAAFFGQTSKETTGGWANAPGGPYAWGYCFIRQQPASRDPSDGIYFGRGPIQLTHKYNYQQAGDAIREDLVGKPHLVATDPVISFKTAIWFWMTPQANKPSSHDVITGRWTPSDADRAANRYPGYGVITNIINGGYECGNGPNPNSGERIAFYKRYCYEIFGVTPGGNLNCRYQGRFG